MDPSQVYFKTVPVFETSAHELQWLTRAVFIGLGERQPASWRSTNGHLHLDDSRNRRIPRAAHAREDRVPFRCVRYDAATGRMTLDWGFALLLLPVAATSVATFAMFAAGARGRRKTPIGLKVE